MKKFLLSMVALLGMGLAASAADVTIKGSDYTPGIDTKNEDRTANVDGYTVDVKKNNGSTAPALNEYNGEITLRVYAKGTVTVSGAKLTKIVFNLNTSTGAKRYTTFTPNVGSITTQAAGDESITWTGDATSVTFTVGDLAEYGSESSKNGQIHILNMVITGEGGGSVDPTPDPDPDPDPTPDPVGDDIYASDFSNGASGFTYEDGTLPEGLTYVWTVDKSYGYLKASAYVKGTNYAAESYAVSPVLDLTNRDNATLTFSHVMNFFTSIEVAKTETGLFVREEGSSNWTKVEFANYPTALGWKPWIENTVDLSAYVGKKIQLGFWYKSTEAKSGTWEVKDVKVVGKASTGIADVNVDENAPVEYFNLQGVRVANPENGLYIRRQGNKTTKVLVK